MIKKYGSFVAGMAAMLLVASLVGSVFAASSRVEYNQAGISLFGEDKVLAGETCKAPNGQGVPSVIIYVDVAEDKTNYLSIRQISKLLGIEVRRDSQKNRVNLGAAPADYVVERGAMGVSLLTQQRPYLEASTARLRRSIQSRPPASL